MNALRFLAPLKKRIVSRLKRHDGFDRKDRLIQKGISSRTSAFTGPRVLEIDLTERCANRCLACWVHSPLLSPKPPSETPASIELTDLLGWIPEFRRLEIETIQIAGAGEPLCHPDFRGIVRALKKGGFCVHLITSLYPLSPGLARFLVECGVDRLTASIWAGDRATWSAVHPGIDDGAFSAIERFLSELRAEKTAARTALPRLRLFQVILRENHENLETMADFGIRHFADEMEFQVMDPVPGVTDSLKITPRTLERIVRQVDNLRSRPDFTGEFIGPGNRLETASHDPSQEQKEFGRFYHPFPPSFRLEEDRRVTCPRGMKSVKRAWTHDHPHPAFSYEFSNECCASCAERRSCYPSPRALPAGATFMNLTGIGSFLRRARAQAEGIPAESGLCRTLPCTAGWYYGRILSDARFIPCCKASGLSTGSLKKERLGDIWFGESQRRFRIHCLTRPKTDPFFAPIQCMKGCDNLGSNLDMIRRGLVPVRDITEWNENCLKEMER